MFDVQQCRVAAHQGGGEHGRIGEAPSDAKRLARELEGVRRPREREGLGEARQDAHAQRAVAGPEIGEHLVEESA